MYSAQFKIYWAQNAFFSPHLKYSFCCALHSAARGGRTTPPFLLSHPSNHHRSLLQSFAARMKNVRPYLEYWRPCAWSHRDKSKDFSSTQSSCPPYSPGTTRFFFFLFPFQFSLSSNWNRNWKVADLTRSLTFGRTWWQNWLSSRLASWPGVSEAIRTLQRVCAVSQGLLWGKLLTDISLCAWILLYFNYMTLFPNGVRVNQLRGGLLLGAFAKLRKATFS